MLAVLGPEGSFCDIAAKKNFPDKRNYYSTISYALDSVRKNENNHALVPLENSFQGTVVETLDYLTFNNQLKIHSEIVTPIKHCLIGYSLDKIDTILSHPQALAQCRGWITKNLPDARLEKTLSTSEAVKKVSEMKKPNLAAIASEEASRVYGLKILVSGIQDAEDNITRFVEIGRKVHEPTGYDKTSIVFYSYENRPGLLWEILGEFAKRNINLTKIESRPSKKVLGDYLFYLDFEGHQEDEKTKDCLGMIKKKVAFLKILGSYPKKY